jgi:outer membrane lipoprotein SlyB
MATADTIDKHSGLLYPMMLIAAIAVIMLSLAGIAMVMGWMPGAVSGGGPAAAEADRPRAAEGRAARCRECGVIESILAIEVEKNMNQPTSYQIRVRMNDGTYRMVIEQEQPVLRAGQRVRVTERGLAAAN